MLMRRSMDSLNLLHELRKRDETTRHDAISTIQRVLDSWYFGFGSPVVTCFLETVVKDTGGSTLDTSMHGFIREQIPDLLRISFTAPIFDVRSSTLEILNDLKTKKGFKIPQLSSPLYSSIILNDKIDYLSCITDEPSEDDPYFTTYVLFCEYWFHWGRLCNYITIMGFHPEYLECYMKLEDHLFHGDLLLPYPDRYYLAIMAAAEQKCIYLVLLFAQRFISSGGCPSWLQGIEYGPAKWRQLSSLNKKLAEKPWQITSDDIYKLTRRSESNPSKETISLSEFMHVVTILTQIHALSCFVFGCGIRPEIDHYDGLVGDFGQSDVATEPPIAGLSDDADNHKNGNLFNDDSNQSNASASVFDFDVCHCMSKSTDDYSVYPNGDQGDSSEVEDGSASHLLKIILAEDPQLDEACELEISEQFLNAVSSNAKLDLEAFYWKQKISVNMESTSKHPILMRFVDSQYSISKNFDGEPFHISEFLWQEEGSALADRLCTDLGSLLDDKFRSAYDLTYNTLNSITNVDTSLYRRTVWNLVQSFVGIYHDDFCYDRIDRLLNSTQRAFLKLCAISPVAVSTMKGFTYEKVFPALSVSEIVHVILMVIEARQQACLLYILRAISECQARSN